jgi:hypothetical protein
MIKLLSSRLLWGLVLIIGGALLLLDTFGIFQGGALFWTVVSAFAGVLFLALYISDHNHWWALIPGTIFLAVSATIGLTSFLPGFSESNWSGVVILGGIALSFLLVYLAERGNWWALIPMGVLATIALVAFVDTGKSSLASGGIFFLGLGLTFALVALLPNSIGPMRWAWIPAGILGVIGILLLASQEYLINYVWPAALIIGGAQLIIRALRRK